MAFEWLIVQTKINPTTPWLFLVLLRCFPYGPSLPQCFPAWDGHTDFMLCLAWESFFGSIASVQKMCSQKPRHTSLNRNILFEEWTRLRLAYGFVAIHICRPLPATKHLKCLFSLRFWVSIQLLSDHWTSKNCAMTPATFHKASLAVKCGSDCVVV